MAAIPAFVVNGSHWLSTEADGFGGHYRSEADLRDMLATMWWLNGAEVRTEVAVPNCGRIDILVERAESHLIIEVKKEITKAAQARKAFGQTRDYLAFMRMQSGYDRVYEGLITAADIDWAACQPAMDAHDGHSVEIDLFADALREPLNHRDPLAKMTARVRRGQVQKLLGLLDHAAQHNAMQLESLDLALINSA